VGFRSNGTFARVNASFKFSLGGNIRGNISKALHDGFPVRGGVVRGLSVIPASQLQSRVFQRQSLLPRRHGDKTETTNSTAIHLACGIQGGRQSGVTDRSTICAVKNSAWPFIINETRPRLMNVRQPAAHDALVARFSLLSSCYRVRPSLQATQMPQPAIQQCDGRMSSVGVVISWPYVGRCGRSVVYFWVRGGAVTRLAYR